MVVVSVVSRSKGEQEHDREGRELKREKERERESERERAAAALLLLLLRTCSSVVMSPISILQCSPSRRRKANNNSSREC